jgi:hypothetical protein
MTNPMGAKRYIFDIYCKGKEEDIEEFLYRAERIRANEKWGKWSCLYDGEAMELDDAYLYPERADQALPYSCTAVMSFCPIEAACAYTDPFLSIIKDFTVEKHKPLSIFFDLHQSCDRDRTCCVRSVGWGCTVYENGVEKNRRTSVLRLTGYEEEGEREAARERHDEEILPLLYTWLYDFSTPALCLAAVRADKKLFSYVPEKFMDEELCLLALKENPQAVKAIPDSRLTEKICLTAINQNGETLQYVPEKLKTEEIILAAVEQNGVALEYVGEERQTPVIIHAAIKDSRRSLAGYLFSLVAEKFKTPELCLLVTQKSGYALAFIPEALKTAEICRLAVQDAGYYLKDVPEKLRTAELCRMAVEKDGNAIIYVPDALLTPELCLIAVQESSLAIRKIPPKLRTAEVWHTARSARNTE